MISVIIPAHNECTNLKELLPYLNSLQNRSDYEIIVCLSSHNSDASHAICQEHQITAVNCPAKGRAHQMNQGALYANGEVYAFLHADARPPRTFFDDIQTTLSAEYEAGFFSYRFDKKSFFLKINSSFTKKDGLFTGGGDQCLFIKRSVFDALGRFDERQLLMEDYELFKRMRKQGISYTIVPNDMLVSARKYERNSYLRVNLSNLLMFTLFQLGWAPERLLALHQRLIK